MGYGGVVGSPVVSEFTYLCSAMRGRLSTQLPMAHSPVRHSTTGKGRFIVRLGFAFSLESMLSPRHSQRASILAHPIPRQCGPYRPE